MIEAHGIGGQADLPIPLEFAVAGAVAALVLSFVVLTVAWRQPRYATARPWDPRTGRAGRAMDVIRAVADAAGTPVALRVLGMVLLVFTAATAMFGQNQVTNPFFGIVYVWWWVGVAVASVLFGPVWRAISPVRTINAGLARLSGGDPRRGIVDYPEWLGHWPAALGLFAFVWLELVYRYPTDLGAVRLWCALYLAVMLVGGAVFGHRFYARADPFEVYSTLMGKLSVWARDADGRLVLRSPLANLSTVVPRPGLVAVVGVLFGSTAFDSFRESGVWVRFTYDATWTKFTLDNIMMVVFCLAAGGLFAAACAAVGGRGHLPVPHRQLGRLLAHSIAPIIAGYIIAHYLTLLTDVGTQTLARASDPFGKGWDILGTAGLEPSYWLSYHPTLLASLKVLAVVIGHVAAAVSAHDRALELLPPRLQVVGQIPLLVVMVVFTGGGLFLLFNA